MDKFITKFREDKKSILGYGFLFFSLLGVLLLIIGLQTQFQVSHNGNKYNENWQSFTEKYRVDIFFALQNYSSRDMMYGNLISGAGISLIKTAIAGFSFLLISLPFLLGYLYVIYQDYIKLFTRRMGKKLEAIKAEDAKERAEELKANAKNKVTKVQKTTVSKPKSTTSKTVSKPKSTTNNNIKKK